ncbi:MAG: molybdopterin molybdenumtransferase MoeA, partial [Novosphingobium sp.]
MALLELGEAQARLLALAPELSVEAKPVTEACGFFLHHELKALVSRPDAATSAMDGYALRASEGHGPWRVIGESAAGHPFAGHVGPGDAVRIATGALLPLGADVVVIQEDCDRDGDTLTLTAPLPPPGRHVRGAASDFGAHDTLLAAGSTMTAAAIALALAGGHRSVAVRRSPRISLIDSGDELVAAGAAGPGQVAASNAAM